MGVVYWRLSSYIAAVTLARQPTETSAYVQLRSISHLQLRFVHILANFDTAFPKTCGVCICGSHRRWWLLFLNWFSISEGYISTTVPSNSLPRGKGHWIGLIGVMNCTVDGKSWECNPLQNPHLVVLSLYWIHRTLYSFICFKSSDNDRDCSVLHCASGSNVKSLDKTMIAGDMGKI